MSEKNYTLVVNGKPTGPFSLEELRNQIVSPESFIRKTDMDDYKEAHEFPELRALFGFDKQFTKPQYFAGFDLRLLASCIDWFVLITLVVLVELIILSITNKQEKTILLLTSNVFIIPVVKFIYHVLLESKFQTTIGKRVLNIKVTDINGLKPSFSSVFYRNILKILSTGLLFGGYLYSFLNKKHQCLHDVLANTLVIKDRLI